MPPADRASSLDSAIELIRGGDEGDDDVALSVRSSPPTARRARSAGNSACASSSPNAAPIPCCWNSGTSMATRSSARHRQSKERQPDQLGRRPSCNPIATGIQRHRGHGRCMAVTRCPSSLLVTATVRLCRPLADRPAVTLITRRSQVQILPPPPNRRPETLSFRAFCVLRVGWRLPTSSTGSTDGEAVTWRFVFAIR